MIQIVLTLIVAYQRTVGYSRPPMRLCDGAAHCTELAIAGGCMYKRGLAVGTVATAVLCSAATAMAFPANAAYALSADDQPSVSITVRGQVASVHGEGLKRGTPAAMTYNDQLLVRVAVDDHGAFTASLILEGCGANTVTAMGAGPNGTVSASSTVIGACAPGRAPGTSLDGAIASRLDSTTAALSDAAPAPPAAMEGTAGQTSTGRTAGASSTHPAADCATVASGATVTAVSGTLPRKAPDVALPGLALGLGLVVAVASILRTRRRRTGERA